MDSNDERAAYKKPLHSLRATNPTPSPLEKRALRGGTFPPITFMTPSSKHGEETVALLAIGASMLKLKVERCGGENNRKILTKVSASMDVTIMAPNALAGSKSLANASHPTAAKARCTDVGRRIRPTVPCTDIRADGSAVCNLGFSVVPDRPRSHTRSAYVGCQRLQGAALGPRVACRSMPPSILSNDTPNNTPHIADADARGAQTIWIWWGRVSALQEEAGRLRGVVEMAVEKWEEETSTAEQMVTPHPPSSTTQHTGVFLRIFQVLCVCKPSSRKVGCHWKGIREEGRTCKRNDVRVPSIYILHPLYMCNKKPLNILTLWKSLCTMPKTPGSKAAKPTTPYTITKGKKRGMLAQSGQATLENIVALQQHGLKADSKAFNTTKKYGEVVVAGGKWLEEYVGGNEKTGKEKKGHLLVPDNRSN
ncbi:hypothetical protein B0H14DRAFT_2637651 [Mycena olivaceomarginata]|nr:hypothetical protein B0H14DRAFT_2637651 [Mycena olivaceomarginata]